MGIDIFNTELNNLRELFHKYGAFNDSNAKLDEVVKILSMQIYQLKTKDLKPHSFNALLKKYEIDDSFDLKTAANELFVYITQQAFYSYENGNSIFGSRPQLVVESIDNNILFQVMQSVLNIVNIGSDSNSFDFDLINEVFGHFVRDNFRGNIEDAQYMTPAEVVDFMSEIAIDEIKRKGYDGAIKICDPCCGVGSFLSALYSSLAADKKTKGLDVSIVGQDKVERMARLTKINLALFDSDKSAISFGNSLIGESDLGDHENTIDVILTNPPFGAKFGSEELTSEKLKYPLLNSLFDSQKGTFSSEVLFIDRCLSLLTENGFLLAVVPDNVISASGVSHVLRQKIINDDGIALRGIIELPAVTFAQAGTRTKTSILFLEKNSEFDKGSFIGICNSLGFEVSVRKGVTNKYSEGENELPQLLECYRNIHRIKKDKEGPVILSESPSSVLVDQRTMRMESWTPSHFNVRRFRAIEQMQKKKDVKLKKLSEVASFESKIRGKAKNTDNSKCISVLHVYNEDMLAIEEVFSYNPKYPGYNCQSGDLLFSKINPRIPRMIIVPDLKVRLTCSSEFEILKAKNGLSNEELKVLLSLPMVQEQIVNLTSGTSSSHNRIKSKDLANVMIPIPNEKSKSGKEFKSLITKLDKGYKKMMALNLETFETKQQISESF